MQACSIKILRETTKFNASVPKSVPHTDLEQWSRFDTEMLSETYVRKWSHNSCLTRSVCVCVCVVQRCPLYLFHTLLWEGGSQTSLFPYFIESCPQKQRLKATERSSSQHLLIIWVYCLKAFLPHKYSPSFPLLSLLSNSIRCQPC